jgi:hypothetical protein
VVREVAEDLKAGQLGPWSLAQSIIMSANVIRVRHCQPPALQVQPAQPAKVGEVNKDQNSVRIYFLDVFKFSFSKQNTIYTFYLLM